METCKVSSTLLGLRYVEVMLSQNVVAPLVVCLVTSFGVVVHDLGHVGPG